MKTIQAMHFEQLYLNQLNKQKAINWAKMLENTMKASYKFDLKVNIDSACV